MRGERGERAEGGGGRRHLPTLAASYLVRMVRVSVINEQKVCAVTMPLIACPVKRRMTVLMQRGCTDRE